MRVKRTAALAAIGLALTLPNWPDQDRTKRSSAARREFKRLHPCPSTHQPTGRCPGYVIDHIEPLACGGEDAPRNMQWQTIEEAKDKDKWERRECGGQ